MTCRFCAEEASQWEPWLAALPERVTLPIAGWSDAEVRALGDPDTVREALAVRDLISSSFQVCALECWRWLTGADQILELGTAGVD